MSFIYLMLSDSFIQGYQTFTSGRKVIIPLVDRHGDFPSIMIWPPSNRKRPAIALRTVDFPAPFVPNTPIICPSSAVNVISSNAFLRLNVFMACSTLIMAFFPFPNTFSPCPKCLGRIYRKTAAILRFARLSRSTPLSESTPAYPDRLS